MNDLINRQVAIDALGDMPEGDDDWSCGCRNQWARDIKILRTLPSVKSKKSYTKADYIMNLHKEYGCTFVVAEEAHNKALEFLRDKAMLKG